MHNLRDRLLATFLDQHRFSLNYSALYATFFLTVAGWLVEDEKEPVGEWLAHAAHGRQPLDVSLLLAAGLHRDVLLGEPDLTSLSRYYPSAGGNLPAGWASDRGWHIEQGYERSLRQAILQRREPLQAFIQNKQVQTNETGRGIAWLLPATLAGWTRFHLVDFGASAGLNLTADRRSYQFFAAGVRQPYLTLGHGAPVQFQVRSPGGFNLPAARWTAPEILGRLGCDAKPFILRTPHDEATLAAFIWPDQTARLQRLHEGIAAFHQVNKSRTPVQLHTVDLPGGLPHFLEKFVSDDSEAVICYNTYIRMYLPDRGVALRRCMHRWARGASRPVVWIQWEPPSCLKGQYGQAPDDGWLAWTIDLWHRGEHNQWHVAWVHPHGQRVHWLPGLNDWTGWAGTIDV